MKKLVLFATIFAAVAFTACNSKTTEEAAPVVETEEVVAPVEEATEEVTEEVTEEAPAEAAAE